jgi:hypothetical protein
MTYDVQALLALIRDIDRGSDAGYDSHNEYVQVMRWNKGGDDSGGQDDDAATAIVRALLREKLGGFPLDEIGAAVLAQIDAKTAA